MSQKFDLSSEDLKRSLHWSLVFIAPLAVIYLTSVIAIVTLPFHVFHFSDLIPNAVTTGALALYILDRLYDILMRFIADNKTIVAPPTELG